MSRQKSSFWLLNLVCVAAVIGLPSIVPAQQEGEIVQLAIETNPYSCIRILGGGPGEADLSGFERDRESPARAHQK
jgi:hypothetical protein